MFDTDYSHKLTTYPNAVSDIRNYTSVEYGAGQEGSTASNATYEFIRVVKNPNAATTHTVTYNLTDCTSTNTETTVTHNAAYAATI